MLYVTTRNEREHYPALRTLGRDYGPDGGAFVPFRLPVFSREEVEAFLARDPYQIHQLNRFILKEYFPTERSEMVKDWCR